MKIKNTFFLTNISMSLRNLLQCIYIYIYIYSQWLCGYIYVYVYLYRVLLYIFENICVYLNTNIYSIKPLQHLFWQMTMLARNVYFGEEINHSNLISKVTNLKTWNQYIFEHRLCLKVLL